MLPIRYLSVTYPLHIRYISVTPRRLQGQFEDDSNSLATITVPVTAVINLMPLACQVRAQPLPGAMPSSGRSSCTHNAPGAADSSGRDSYTHTAPRASATSARVSLTNPKSSIRESLTV